MQFGDIPRFHFDNNIEEQKRKQRKKKQYPQQMFGILFDDAVAVGANQDVTRGFIPFRWHLAELAPEMSQIGLFTTPRTFALKHLDP